VAQVLDLDRRDIVDQLHSPVCRVAVEPVFERGRRQRARMDGPRNRWVQATGLPSGSGPGDPVVVIRAIHIVLDVLLRVQTTFTGLRPLSRCERLWFRSRLEPAAESTPKQMVVDDDLLRREARDLGRRCLHPTQHLGPGPDFATVVPDVHRAVHRLHGGVRQEGDLVHGFDFLRRTRKRRVSGPLFPCNHAWVSRSGVESRTTSSVDIFPFGPSSQRIASAANPCFAAHM